MCKSDTTSMFVALRSTLALCIVVFFSTQLHTYATGWPQAKNHGFGKAYYASATASSYYDVDGTVTTELQLPDIDDTTSQSMRFDYDFQVFGIYGEFGVSEDLTLVADFPFVAISLKETTEAIRRVPSANVLLSSSSDTTLDIAAFAYYGLGARYVLVRGSDINILGLLDIRVPPGFHDGLYSDTDFEFLSDGAFSMRLGGEFGIPISGGWIAGRAAYAMNAEERSDEIHINLEGGLNTVENAQIKLFLDANIALDEATEARPFHIRETPSVQESIVTGGSFIFNFSRDVFADFTISAPLSGTNTWNAAAVSVGIGLKFDVDADTGE